LRHCTQPKSKFFQANMNTYPCQTRPKIDVPIPL